jgi:hypothetical protein
MIEESKWHLISKSRIISKYECESEKNQHYIAVNHEFE